MVRKFQSLPVEQREHMRGGDGTVTLTPGLQAGRLRREAAPVFPYHATCGCLHRHLCASGRRRIFLYPHRHGGI